MLKLLAKLFDPRVQLLLVGILSVVAGVLEYLIGNDFVKGYPEIVGALIAVNGIVLAVYKVVQAIVVAPIKRKMASKNRVADWSYIRNVSSDKPFRG